VGLWLLKLDDLLWLKLLLMFIISIQLEFLEKKLHEIWLLYLEL
jgi:hypothetical protein